MIPGSNRYRLTCRIMKPFSEQIHGSSVQGRVDLHHKLIAAVLQLVQMLSRRRGASAATRIVRLFKIFKCVDYIKVYAVKSCIQDPVKVRAVGSKDDLLP